MIRFFLSALMLVQVAIPLQAAESEDPKLSYTRLLRRVNLKLLGRSPTIGQYQAIIGAANDDAREAIIQKAIDDALESPAFYTQILEFGFDYLGVGQYDISWSIAAHIDPCAEGTQHAGKWAVFRPNEGYPDYGDSTYICDENDGPCDENNQCDSGFTCDQGSFVCVPISCTADADCGLAFICNGGQCIVPTATLEPWWAPGSTIETIGWAGQGHTSVPYWKEPAQEQDCGVIRINVMSKETVIHGGDNSFKPRCGCGPNLIYCARRMQSQKIGGETGMSYDGYATDPNGILSSLFQEPARLFAHLIVNDRPFDDLVLANYTVVNQGLQHFYVRAARQTGRFDELDQSLWWQEVADPNAWREVVVEEMYPLLLAERDTKFDPTLDYGEPKGLPSAGVLTTIGSLGSFMRERPRAARWLENLTCREFNPPDPQIQFGPFEYDPGTQGVCQQCHQLIDPAAIHFKRFGAIGQHIAGLSPYRWNAIQKYGNPLWKQVPGWDAQYIPNTLMTPVSEMDIAMNPDARFFDFAPPGTTLFGATGDGTIGPLGFGKMIVASGEFDRCTVRRFYERYGGLKLNPAKHKLYIDKLLEVYLESGKKIRPLIKWIVSQPRFRKGH